MSFLENHNDISRNFLSTINFFYCSICVTHTISLFYLAPDTFCQSFSKLQDCGILDQLLIQLWICVLKKICKVAVIQDKYFSCAYGHKDSCILHIYMYVYIKHVCAVHYIVIHSQIEIIYKIQRTAHFTSNGTEIEKYAPTA